MLERMKFNTSDVFFLNKDFDYLISFGASNYDKHKRKSPAKLKMEQTRVQIISLHQKQLRTSWCGKPCRRASQIRRGYGLELGTGNFDL